MKQYLKYSLRNKIVQACIVYFCITVLWVFGSDHFNYALSQIKINKVFLYSVLFVAILKRDFLDKFLLTFMIGLLINVLWSYLIFFNIASSPFLTTGNLPLLIKSDHGYFVLIGLGYSLYRLLTYDDKLKYKFIFIVFLCAESINIFLTDNKTSMIIYLFSMLLVLCFVFRKKWINIVAIMSLITVFSVTIVHLKLNEIENTLIQQISDVENSLTSNRYDSSIGARIGVIGFAFGVIKEHILFGVGTGDHIIETQNIMEQSDLENTDKLSYNFINGCIFNTGAGASLHNTYLNVLVQFGLIGLVAFLYIFYFIIRIGTHRTKQEFFLSLLIVFITLIHIIPGWDFGFGNFGKFFIFFIAMINGSVSDK